MERHPFFIVDVFAERKYAGNPLAVVLDPRGSLSAAEMQRIAREFHFSETTFVVSEAREDGGYEVRIFAPREEVPFAGHPTLGTAHVLLRELGREPAPSVRLHLPVGPVPVVAEGDRDGGEVLVLEAPRAELGREVAAARAAAALSLKTGDIDSRLPVREASAGLPFLVVPLGSLDALRRCRIDGAAAADLTAPLAAKAILVFCRGGRQVGNDLSMRVFAHYYGVAEDPATGSAAACLGGYLAETGVLPVGGADLRIEQGHEIDRPSLLLLRVEERQGRRTVSVGGRVVTVARGQLA